MKCPFCDSEISDQAVICVHCGKDLAANSTGNNRQTNAANSGNGLRFIKIGLIVVAAANIISILFFFIYLLSISFIFYGISFIVSLVAGAVGCIIILLGCNQLSSK